MKLRWGIIGLGKIAEHFANDFVNASHTENEIVAVASRTEDKARAFAQNHNIARYYGTYEELLKDPNVDIVYIATPHNSHKTYTIDTLNSGKHVLCEKPIGVSAIEVEEMKSVAEDRQLFLMEALWTRWNPVILEVVKLLDSGKLGNIIKANADFGFPADLNPEGRLLNPALAGGALLDIGIYQLFLAYLLLGKPNSISAKAILSKSGVDLKTSALLHYAQNIEFTVECTLQEDTETTATITCDNGEIIIHRRWHEADSYQIVDNEGKVEVRKIKLNNRGYYEEVKHCHEMISRGQISSNMWSLDDSLQLLQIMDEVRSQIGLLYPFE